MSAVSQMRILLLEMTKNVIRAIEMYKLAVFDLDGTILDTLEDLADALNHTLALWSYPLRTTEETRAMVGRGLRNLLKSATGLNEGDKLDAMLSELVSFYSSHSAVKTCPYPGIPEMLRELRSRGIKTAVLSNKRDEVTVSLCSHFFPDLFDVCRGERPGVPIKPSPESFLSVMEELGVGADETVYVGDSEVDITTYRNAGTDGIIVTWGFRNRADLELSGADHIADSVGELLSALT